MRISCGEKYTIVDELACSVRFRPTQGDILDLGSATGPTISLHSNTCIPTDLQLWQKRTPSVLIVTSSSSTTHTSMIPYGGSSCAMAVLVLLPACTCAEGMRRTERGTLRESITPPSRDVDVWEPSRTKSREFSLERSRRYGACQERKQSGALTMS